MNIDESELSLDAFANEEDPLPDFPLSFPNIAREQQEDQQLQQLLTDKPELYKLSDFCHANKTIQLITKHDKIVMPESLKLKATEWHHSHLLHPGETRMELTLGQHFTWSGIRNTTRRVCKACRVCKETKHGPKRCGIMPPKDPEVIPWHALCVDLIGLCKIGKGKKQTILHCLTMIDPATGWFEIAQAPNRRADEVSNVLEMTWLTRHPWPTEVIMDRGREFAREVREMLINDCGCVRKLITTRNPQANSMVERVHQVIGNMVNVLQLRNVDDLGDLGWSGILSAIRQAVRSTAHTTTRATPTQLVFGRDALLNIGFEANWQCVKDRKQKRIPQNNARENESRIVHQCNIGDRVMVRQKPNRKCGSDKQKGPCTVTRVNDNGTLTLTKVTTNGGAVTQTWNVRNIDPCRD